MSSPNLNCIDISVHGWTSEKDLIKEAYALLVLLKEQYVHNCRGKTA